LLIALVEKGLTAQAQVPLPVVLWNRVVGEFYADIPVEGRVIVELKAAKALTDEHGARLLNDKKPPGLAGSLILAS
jgi:GxxExxY protein